MPCGSRVANDHPSPAAERPGAVRVLQRVRQDLGDVLRRKPRRERVVLVLPQEVDRAAQVVRHQLGQEVAVCARVGVMPERHVAREYLGVVRQVEVPGEDERPCEAARLVHEGVAAGSVPLAEGGITEMSEEDAFVLGHLAFRDLREQVDERRRRSAFHYHVGACAGDGAGVKDRRARPVLAPVVLLLEEERELGPAPVGRSVLLAVERAVLEKAQQRHAAFVLYFVGHCVSISTGTACRGTWEGAISRRRRGVRARPPCCAGRTWRR